jgi:hypothetical protein
VDRSEYVTRGGLTISISSRLLDTNKAGAADSTDNSVATTSEQIRRLIDLELTSREVNNAS